MKAGARTTPMTFVLIALCERPRPVLCCAPKLNEPPCYAEGR